MYRNRVSSDKQPGIKYCLGVYPHQWLKLCAGIHGSQSNSISSEARSNITIPVKHHAHTKRPSSALTKWEHFVRHSAVMVYISVLLLRWRDVWKECSCTERQKKNHSFASQCLIWTWQALPHWKETQWRKLFF